MAFTMGLSVHDHLFDNHDTSIKSAIFAEDRKVKLVFRLKRPIRCPCCREKLKGHGYTHRTIKSISDKTIDVTLTRVRCDNPNCKLVKDSKANVRPCATFVIYPPGIPPYKRYCLFHLLLLIKLALNAKLSGHPFYLTEPQIDKAKVSLVFINKRLKSLTRNLRVTYTRDQKFIYIKYIPPPSIQSKSYFYNQNSSCIKYSYQRFSVDTWFEARNCSKSKKMTLQG